jgi:hypothetical protein
MALVPRPTMHLDGHRAISRTGLIHERDSFFFALGPAREVFAEDLNVLPNSSGQGLLVHLAFRALDYSGQSEELQSRTVLTLRTQVETKELPLLTGFIGRKFAIRSLEPIAETDFQALKEENSVLKDKIQFLRESLEDLQRSLMDP